MKKKHIGFHAVILLVFVALLQCSNPLKDEKRKELVLVFIDDYLVDTGRYVFYWNGKGDDNEYVLPGKYIILLEIKSWQDQECVDIKDGGKAGENDKSRFEPGYWLDNDLQEPFPNPFRVKSGVNIPILLSAPSRVKISIYKD